jgi:hypothetical protein
LFDFNKKLADEKASQIKNGGEFYLNIDPDEDKEKMILHFEDEEHALEDDLDNDD